MTIAALQETEQQETEQPEKMAPPASYFGMRLLFEKSAGLYPVKLTRTRRQPADRAVPSRTDASDRKRSS